MLPTGQYEDLPTIGNKFTIRRARACTLLPVRKLVNNPGSRVLDENFPTAGLLLPNRWLKDLSNSFTIFNLFFLHGAAGAKTPKGVITDGNRVDTCKFRRPDVLRPVLPNSPAGSWRLVWEKNYIVF